MYCQLCFENRCHIIHMCVYNCFHIIYISEMACMSVNMHVSSLSITHFWNGKIFIVNKGWYNLYIHYTTLNIHYRVLSYVIITGKWKQTL